MRFALFALISLAACAEAPETYGTATFETGCSSGGCGENTAKVNGSDISWFRLDRLPNENGVSFVNFATSLSNMRAGIYETLDIAGNHLRYRNASGAWKAHGDLVGSIIRISNNGVLYDIKIAEVHYRPADWGLPCGNPCLLSGEPYWTQAPTGDAETYRLYWAKVDRFETETFPNEVCAADEIDTALWNRAFNAVVFEGEKYDVDTRKISFTATTDFTAPFNIACIGSLPAKQELARRTSATVTNTIHTTIDDDRQALVHAWAAEYCGAGPSFTHQGHKLRVRDRHYWLTFAAPLNWPEPPPPNLHIEAVWDKDHAVCLDTPRLAIGDDPKVPADPQIWKKIAATCTLPPRCSDQPWFPDHWRDHGDFLTATVGTVVVQP